MKIHLKSSQPFIRTSLRVALKTLGINFSEVSESEAEVVFGDNAEQRQEGRLILLSTQYDKLLLKQERIQNNQLFLPEGAFLNSGAVDWLYVFAFFVLGGAEREIDLLEDKEFIVPGEACTFWGLDKNPTAFLALKNIKLALEERTKKAGNTDLWPQGKTWAIVITHDVDRIRKYRTISFFKDARLFFKYSPLRSAQFIFKGLLSIFKNPMKDPYTNSLWKWLEFERKNGIKATYFTMCKSRYDVDSDIRDAHYTAQDQIISNLRGNSLPEISLHNSINSTKSKQQFQKEIEDFERSFGTKPIGFRGHFWNWGKENYMDIQLKAEELGIRYSSNFGMNTVAGFRRGMCYPFPVFDEQRISNCWEIPPTFMDFAFKGNRINNNLKEHLKCVKEVGGLAVLNWHTDTIREDFLENSTEIVLEELSKVFQDKTCWITSNEGILDWLNRELN